LWYNIEKQPRTLLTEKIILAGSGAFCALLSRFFIEFYSREKYMRRAQEREQAFKLVFESMFSGFDLQQAAEAYEENGEALSEYAKEIYNGVCEHKEELDSIVARYSNGWKPSRLPKVNLSILRVALYEMLYRDDIPESVSVNEAVELAKTFSGKEDSAFINGILGSFSRGEK
jgi:N utilization substance protein B